MTRLEFNIFALSHLLKSGRIASLEAGELLEKCLGVAATAPEPPLGGSSEFGLAHLVIHRLFDKAQLDASRVPSGQANL